MPSYEHVLLENVKFFQMSLFRNILEGKMLKKSVGFENYSYTPLFTKLLTSIHPTSSLFPSNYTFQG